MKNAFSHNGVTLPGNATAATQLLAQACSHHQPFVRSCSSLKPFYTGLRTAAPGGKTNKHRTGNPAFYVDLAVYFAATHLFATS